MDANYQRPPGGNVLRTWSTIFRQRGYRRQLESSNPGAPRATSSQDLTMRLTTNLILLALGVLSPALAADSKTAPRPLRVCLVSGAETYNSDQAFAGLAAYLEREHDMQPEVLSFSPDGTSIPGIERLLEADTAVFHVRRKTLNPEHLAVLRKFFASGKGFVALRSTSHGWENWKEFDREVLGMKYGGPGGNNAGNAVQLHFKPHPVWEGTQGLDTKKDLYRVSEPAPDITVILEGETKNGLVPVAWTRPHHDARLVYIALFYEMDQRPFRRAIANAIQWVTAPAAPSR